MSDAAIRVESLGKRYRIGEVRSRHDTLRDALGRSARGAIRTLGSLARPGRGVAEQEWIWALKDVSLQVAQGEVLGIIGPNGAGKSTLLKVLSRITEPTTGTGEIRGRVVSLLEVGTGFHAELTGRENVYLNGAILGMKRAEITRKFDEIVGFAEVERFIDTPVKHYSSGMYLRLAFAVAAHLEPEILIVDEVLAVGDAEFQKRCLGKMQDVAERQGRTVLFVSHNMNVIQRLCGRCVLVRAGRILDDGRPGQVVARYLSDSSAASGPARWIDVSRAARTGTGAAMVQAVRYTSGSEDAAFQPFPNGPLEFLVRVSSDEHRSVESMAVAVYDQHGTMLVNADTLALGRRLTFDTGDNLVRLRISELHLNPGKYSVGFWIAGTNGAPIYDYTQSAVGLEVVDLRPEGLGRRPNVDGVVPCRFEVSQEAL